jgi:hypothetical protein
MIRPRRVITAPTRRRPTGKDPGSAEPLSERAPKVGGVSKARPVRPPPDTERALGQEMTSTLPTRLVAPSVWACRVLKSWCRMRRDMPDSAATSPSVRSRSCMPCSRGLLGGRRPRLVGAIRRSPCSPRSPISTVATISMAGAESAALSCSSWRLELRHGEAVYQIAPRHGHRGPPRPRGATSPARSSPARDRPTAPRRTCLNSANAGGPRSNCSSANS